MRWEPGGPRVVLASGPQMTDAPTRDYPSQCLSSPMAAGWHPEVPSPPEAALGSRG